MEKERVPLLMNIHFLLPASYYFVWWCRTKQGYQKEDTENKADT